ncbi:threonine synthase [Aquirufa regiilacus]|uniref:Threonine synthase n=1 Tax=Aquirufa regiilacus TaxID=3024868 RepID=A0ABU3TS57_9BACT|nr:threonine synthase [Aquirufa sp. LEOWEIH-7C]MDU0808702.1 threonine synthase [Aquirufa sp. LEOWEIH-7C]
MKLYSTQHESADVDLQEAIFRGLPPDNGLYMPYEIPSMPASFFESIHTLSLPEIAKAVCKNLLGDDLTDSEIDGIIDSSMTFEAPVVSLEENVGVLELFHGPSMAFKDFGARFMAAIMSHYLVKAKREIRILVATSGDTGGAVAQGFYNTPGISVTILYPTGKVSDIQEKQLTTLGGNVTALEIDGTFDDCQRLVKQAFLDEELRAAFNLASANSINIARLIPQSFYYFAAYAVLRRQGVTKPVVFSVPSGNFGNLSAGLMAYQMGLPIQAFVAACNANHPVPDYLASGNYNPKPSVETISNAMDVGAPSNFIRMRLLAGDAIEQVRKIVKGYDTSDEKTKEIMLDVYQRTGYVMCPHTAVAYDGLTQYALDNPGEYYGVLLSTAHYAKFLPTVESTLGTKVVVPARLAALLDKQKKSIPMGTDFEGFKKYLLL